MTWRCALRHAVSCCVLCCCACKAVSHGCTHLRLAVPTAARLHMLHAVLCYAVPVLLLRRVVSPEGTYTLQAESEYERAEWIAALQV